MKQNVQILQENNIISGPMQNDFHQKQLKMLIIQQNHPTLGPIIDAINNTNLFYKEKFMIIEIRLMLSMLNVLLPSVYDALLVIRPSCNFRDGRVIINYTANFRQYFIELPFNDGVFVRPYASYTLEL